MAKSVELGSRAAGMASYLFFGKIISLALVGISFIIVGRLLGPAQYGIYTLATAFAGIFGLIGYFGIGTALQKFIAQYSLKKREGVNHLISTALAMVTFSGIVLLIIFVLLSKQISQYLYHTSGMVYIVELASALIVATMLFGTLYDTLIGLGKGRNVAILTIIVSFFQATISIVLAIMGFAALAPLYGLVFGYFIGFLVGMFFLLGSFGISIKMPSMPYMKTILSFSAPVALSNILGNVVSNVGIIFLSYFGVPTELIGNLGLASKASSVVSLVLDSIVFAILPVYSVALSDKKSSKNIGSMYGYTVYVAFLLVAPILFYITTFSVPLVYTLFGGTYASAPLFVQIASVGILVGIIGVYANTLLISSGRTGLVLSYNIWIYLAMILLLLLFIPLFAALGYAVVIFVLIPLFTDIVFLAKLRKLYTVRLKLGKLARLVLANLILALVFIGVGNIIGGIPLLLLGAIGFVVIYPILAVVLGGADAGDIGTIKQLSGGIPIVGVVLRVLSDYASLMIR